MLEAVTAQENRTPVIEVNGEYVYADEIRARVSMLRAEAEASGEELSTEERFALRPQAIEDLVDRLLMRQEAARLKMTPTEAEIEETLASIAPKYDGSEGCRADAADAESRDDIRSRLMIDRLLAKWFDGVRQPKIHELKEFYRNHPEYFETEELIGASHIVKHPAEGEEILTEPPADLIAVRESILAGEEFVEAAKRFSDCPERGGDLGYFPRGVMVDEFDEVAFSAKVGEVTQPFRTQFGWHIVLVRDRRAPGQQPFEEVSGQIQQRLLREKQEQEIGAKLTALRKKAKYVELQKV
jgi:parvulin-like peptidyl-prolyl isomerase